MSDAPRSSLTVDRIVDAAIALADREGLAAVSMRAIARELGSGVMSLYRHVQDRDDLIGHMADRVASAYPYASPDVITWRDALERMARQDWRSYLDHPWMVEIVGKSRPPITPKTIENYGWIIEWLAPLGLSPFEQHRIAMVVVSWTVGMATFATVDRREAERTGISTDEWWDRQEERIVSLTPHLDGHMRALLAAAPQDGRDKRFGVDEHEDFFSFGLTALLTGIEASLRPQDG